ncbi:hypothetical protein HYH03_011583 [Edaphochlamys debaryana]|uniref:SAYSvFN domain-containing protein n=1 Tax=Edaphochlamys debaryana TaxID=47281 RepID=A0A835XVR6_9CHLO|nr:hypothetical protein HYH03_011583 [Edaphochlamys debaryana]|eukprot:KAG2489953.1 hypothetical protein HYH03_011583 [Edaphochlamys debaryana]
MSTTATVTLQFIAGPRHSTVLPTKCPVEELLSTVERAFGVATAGGVKVVLRGAALPLEKPGHVVALSDGDTLLVAPQRKAPSPEIVAAALNRGSNPSARPRADDDEEERIALPAGTPAWEVALVEFLRSRCKCPDWVMEWVVLIRPRRFAIFLAFLAGCVAASRVGFGPVFILLSCIAAIFANLGQRRAGEMSAYSIFNRGVRRLPGQLDAEEVDRQMRRGQI